MTGTVSYFFRDQKGLEEALDSIRWPGGPRVWSVGCSAGQEPFTIAMLLAERMNVWKFRNLVIFATDIEEKFGERISRGVYEVDEVNAVKTNKGNEELFKKYFNILGGNRYEVIPEIKNRVIFFRNNILTDDPVSEDFDLVSCKNVFEYFNAEEKRKVYGKLHRALKPGGVLIIDPKQRNREFEAPKDLFERICVNCVERVYRKR